MIPIAQIENLLGYLELDLENRELDNKSDWEETYRVVKEWLDTQRSQTTRGAESGTCPSCLGKGIAHNDRGQSWKCIVCNGTGHV